MATVLKLVMGKPAENAKDSCCTDSPVHTIDIYDLPNVDLSKYRGLICTMGCDQVFLYKHRDRITQWVRAGGTLLASGHPMLPFVDGLPATRKMQFHGLEDVWLTAREPHPVWEGIDRTDVLFNTGVPGTRTFDELKKIGVAGFYARNYLVQLPAGATVITGLGPTGLPVDISYRLGKGEVIVHAGNDLLSFDRPGTSTEGWKATIISYLEGNIR